jgi:hypothetical protein
MAKRFTKITLVHYSKVFKPPMEHKKTYLYIFGNGQKWFWPCSPKRVNEKHGNDDQQGLLN